MALDDLKFAIDAFKTGLNEYQTTQAVNDARQQLSYVNKSTADAGQKFQDTAQIGQDLALRLTAANVAPSRIQEAVGGLVPSASMESQNRATLAGQALGYNKGMDTEKLKAANALEIAKIHSAALLGKDASKEANDMSKYVTDFSKQPQNKPLFDSINKLDEALGSLDQNQGKMGATMATEMAKLGVIRSVAGRVNVQEMQAANESPSLRAKFWKEAGLQATGEVPQNVQEFWKSYISGLKGKAQDRLKQAAEGHVQGANPSWDKAALDKMVNTRYAAHLGGAVPAQSAPQSADIQAALDYLSSPEGLNESPETRKAALNQIKKLQQGK